MSEPSAVGNLVAAVADVLRGDHESLNRIVADARERTRERLLDALIPRPSDRPDGGAIPAPIARPVPHPRSDREINIRLRDGRQLRARIAPAMARRQDLAALARASADNTRRTFDALRRHRDEIGRLVQSRDDLGKRVTALEQRGDLELVGLLKGFVALERQVRDVSARTQAIAVAAGASGAPATDSTVGGPPARTAASPQRLQRLQLRQLQQTRLLALRLQIQSVTTVVNTVQAAAFGERGSILSTNNLLLAGNQLFWSLLDPVLQITGALNPASATVVAALAPIGTLFTGEILLGDRQHVRFVSGVTQVPNTAGAVVRESLRGRVAEGEWPRFRERTDVLITFVTSPPGINASDVVVSVNQGSVEIRVPFGVETDRVTPFIRVAWTVDTGAGDV